MFRSMYGVSLPTFVPSKISKISLFICEFTIIYIYILYIYIHIQCIFLKNQLGTNICQRCIIYFSPGLKPLTIWQHQKSHHPTLERPRWTAISTTRLVGCWCSRTSHWCETWRNARSGRKRKTLWSMFCGGFFGGWGGEMKTWTMRYILYDSWRNNWQISCEFKLPPPKLPTSDK